MRFGIYKKGQGYWVRVLTAAFAGIIIAVGCAWLGESLSTVDLPKPTWTMVANPASGQSSPTLATGTQVTLLGQAAQPGDKPPELGTAEVQSVSTIPMGTQIVVKKFTLKKGTDASQVHGLALATGGPEVMVLDGSPRGKAVIEILYVQAAGVGVLVIVGLIAIYWFVGANPRTVDFLIATDGEMKKVNWSTRKDIIGSTKVVIIWCVLLVAGLFLVDSAFAQFFKLIGVLQK
ncbi:MAG: preprotein translocase subunit SecE [Phycisphaeraceae bacterium]|nr:preprotein translocase subunit SecE [Phycisphaeraceae bacterium]